MVYCSLKETTYYESSANVLNYIIVDDSDNVIYYGHSIKNPKTGINRINITEIIRDWLHSNLEDNWDILSNESGYVCQQKDAYKEFSIISGELLLQKYAVLYDYEDIFTGGDIILSEPVNSRIDPRMKILWTRFGEAAANINTDFGYPGIQFRYTGEKNFDFSEQTRSYYYQSLDNSAITFGTDDNWFTITKTSNEIFTISVSSNTGDSDRVGTFYIMYNNEDLQPVREYFTFVQYKEHLYISFSGITNFSHTSGTSQISFSANTLIEFVSGSSWLNVSNIEQEVLEVPSGIVNVVGTITIDRQLNPYEENRTGSLSFRRKDYQYGEVQTLSVMQYHYYYFDLLSPSAYTVDYEQHTILLSADTNADSVVIQSDGNWVSGTFDRGTITISINENTTESGRSATLSIYTNYSPASPVCIISILQEVNYSIVYLTMEMLEDGTVYVNEFKKSPTDYGYAKGWAIYFSKNGGEWVSRKPGDSISVSSGDVLRLKSNGPQDRYIQDYYTTLSGTTARFNLYGNILSMDYADSFRNYSGISEDYEFYGLFGHTGVVDAKNVIFPTNTKPYCYKSMFHTCENLITAPSILPAETVEQEAYRLMFYDCTSLETAPEISLTDVGVESCMEMFYNCYNLTKAPSVLSDVAYESYREMFSNCRNLETAPELLFNTFGAYSCFYMFSGCNALNYVKCLATDHSADGCITGWLSNVSATGTFVKKQGASWPTGVSGIPSGWTVQEE